MIAVALMTIAPVYKSNLFSLTENMFTSARMMILGSISSFKWCYCLVCALRKISVNMIFVVKCLLGEIADRTVLDIIKL